GVERAAPTVTQSTAGTSWIAAWQARGGRSGPTEWVVRGSRITTGGARAGTATLMDAPGRHVMAPAISGLTGNYLLACGLSPHANSTSIERLQTRRVAWSDSSSSPTLGAVRLVDSTSNGVLSALHLAYDANTRSHWAL